MRGRRHGPHESGFTLVEVLIAIIILGIGIAALLGALAMNAKSSLNNRDQAKAAALLSSAAEYVKSLTYPSTCSAIPAGSLPTNDVAFTVSYGPGQSVAGASLCALQQVPVTVAGRGYNLSVSVIKRPSVESS